MASRAYTDASQDRVPCQARAHLRVVAHRGAQVQRSPAAQRAGWQLRRVSDDASPASAHGPLQREIVWSVSVHCAACPDN